MTEVQVEVSTGATRAAKLLAEKKAWQDTFYADLPSVEMSRQFRRFIQRSTQKRVDAIQKKEAIRDRRKARTGALESL